MAKTTQPPWVEALTTSYPSPKPTPRWKNRYLCVGNAPVQMDCGVCKKTWRMQPGEEALSHCRSWPSAEEARRHGGTTGAARYIGPIQV